MGVDSEEKGDSISITDHYFYIYNNNSSNKVMAEAKSKEQTGGIEGLNTLASQQWYFYGSDSFLGNTFGKIFTSN